MHPLDPGGVCGTPGWLRCTCFGSWRVCQTCVSGGGGLVGLGLAGV